MDYSLSNLALHHLVEENKILENGFINKSQTTQDGLLKLKIHTKEGDKTVIVNDKGFFISKESIAAKQNPGGFSAFLKKFLFNQRIEKIEQKGMDRIVLFYFPNHILILEVFSKGNIILCDKEFNILRAMRKEKWKDRTLAKDEKYNFPSSQGISVLEANEKEFIVKMKENRKTCFGAVVEILNVAPKIIEKCFEELKFDKKKNAKDYSDLEIKKLFKKIKSKYESKSNKVYLIGNVIYSIDVGGEGEEFDSINTAFNELNTVETLEPIVEKEKKVKIDYNKEIEIAKENISKFKETGDAIYLHYSQINEVINAIKKGKDKGFSAKEIMKKINSSKNIIKELDFTRNKVKLKF